MTLLSLLSHALGWAYFTAWSASFVPQLVLNHRRRSVAGLSPDFATTNPLGYAALSVFNFALFFSDAVREQYARRHHGGKPTVSPADVAFAVYAFTMASAIYAQTWLYPAPSQRLSTYNRLVVPLIGLGVLAYGLVVYAGVGQLETLDFLYMFSYIKVYVTASKYVPQALLNHRRQSTRGWSITNILLDFTGGALSLAQLGIDAWLSTGGGAAFWDALFGNPSKLGMSLFTLSFDVLFLVQHYVLYKDAKDVDAVGAEEDVKPPEEDDDEAATAGRRVDERTPLV